MRSYNQISQSAIYKEDDVSVSVTVCGGSYGGGSEVLVIQTLQENQYAEGNRNIEPGSASGKL